jgi:DNA-binding transcriptional regulator YiaG
MMMRNSPIDTPRSYQRGVSLSQMRIANRSLSSLADDLPDLRPEDVLAVRQKWNLTQKDLARMLGVKALTICRWEKGHSHGVPYLASLAIRYVELRLKRRTQKRRIRTRRQGEIQALVDTIKDGHRIRPETLVRTR